jgi:hypothetical protein
MFLPGTDAEFFCRSQLFTNHNCLVTNLIVHYLGQRLVENFNTKYVCLGGGGSN